MGQIAQLPHIPSLLFSRHLIPNRDEATEMSKDLTLSQALGVMAPRSAQKEGCDQYSAEPMFH